MLWGQNHGRGARQTRTWMRERYAAAAAALGDTRPFQVWVRDVFARGLEGDSHWNDAGDWTGVWRWNDAWSWNDHSWRWNDGT